MGGALALAVERVKRVPQIAWVFDLNKCMGCQTCTVACKVLWANDKGQERMWWLKVNTMPGRGYPRDWLRMGGGYDSDGRVVMGRVPGPEDYGEPMDFNYEEVLLAGSPEKGYLRPKGRPSWGPNWDEDVGGGEWPNAYFFYLPRMCNHCSRPSCMDACPYGAIYKREEDGLVVIHPRSCESCAEPLCLAACPYKEIFRHPLTMHAEKCHGCLPRLVQGVAPACVRQCPGRAVWVGLLEDEEGPVHKLVRKWRVALPLRPDYGTQPNVYYIPPLSPPPFAEDGTPDWARARIPVEYLRELFGPEVDSALQTLRQEMDKRRRRPREPSELMDILIAYRFSELLGPYRTDPAEATAP